MKSHPPGPPVAFVTGASSGFGRALTKELLRRGYVVGAVARRLELLESLKAECNAGDRLHVYSCDVSSQNACKVTIQKFLKTVGRVDLVIANAAVADYIWMGEDEPNLWTRLIDINVNGVLNTVLPFIPQMRAQGYGHLSAIGSVASFRAFPHGPYPASKIAVKYVMDGLRMDLKKDNISTSTLCPGFISTEALPKGVALPFLLSPEVAASIAVRALVKRKKTFVFPWQWKFLLPLLRLLPDAFVVQMMKATHVKIAQAQRTTARPETSRS